MLRRSARTSPSVFRLTAAVAAVATLFVPLAVDGANILAFVPMPLKSHFGGFRPMFEELARRGHNVTVVSSFPSAAANYTFVDVSPPKFPGSGFLSFVDPERGGDTFTIIVGSSRENIIQKSHRV